MEDQYPSKVKNPTSHLKKNRKQVSNVKGKLIKENQVAITHKNFSILL